MDIVPVSLAIAQAAKETGWGTSRFALEGNAVWSMDLSEMVLNLQVLKAIQNTR